MTSHTHRQDFATRLLARGCDPRTIQELLGHTGIATTQSDIHVLKRGAYGAQEPLG